MIKDIIRNSIFLSITLLTFGCSQEQQNLPQQSVPAAVPETQSTPISEPSQSINQLSGAETAQIQILVQSGFNSAGRPESDLDAHANRKPEQVLAWAGITEGMSVIDIAAAGGYYTENLAWAVGLEGWVIAQNTPGALDRFGGRNRTTLEQRLADYRLPQVEAYELSYAELTENFEELDAATFVNILHDVYNFQGEDAALNALTTIYDILLPGGFLLLIDHVGLAENDNSQLHRIDPNLVRSLLERAGFNLVAQSDLLANPYDDAAISVFDESIRGNTNRFIFKAVKPAT